MAKSALTELLLVAGTTTTAPLRFQSGTNLATPVAGAEEYNGTFQYLTTDTTSGRGQIPNQQVFRLTSNLGTKGPTIADYFDASSSINLAATSVYEIEYLLYFTKTTAGTLTYTLTASSAPTLIRASHVHSPAAGIASAAAPLTGHTGSQGALTAAFAATASLSSAVNHTAHITARVVTNAATNLRIRVTCSAGTITPLAGSYYRVLRVSTSTGSFAA